VAVALGARLVLASLERYVGSYRSSRP
jgi:hypothetical protein